MKIKASIEMIVGKMISLSPKGVTNPNTAKKAVKITKTMSSIVELYNKSL